MATVTKGRTFVSGETVTPAKLNELVDNATVTAIQTADIGDSQVTTAKIADANVTTAKIADANITTAKIADANITTAKIADANVTAAKLDGAQTGSAPIYGCRAWVNFNGTAGSTVDGEFRCTIRASGNVSKVVRTTTGEYRIHFSTAMADANYAVIGSRGTSASASYPVTGIIEVGAKTASTVDVDVESYANTWAASLTNSDEVNVVIFR